MGTRSLTVFVDRNDKEICRLYRQFDGYFEGHGKELVEFLSGKKIVNGFTKDDDNNFNGMNCLAAQVIAHFKKSIGGFYLYPPNTVDVGEEFVYTITDSDGYPKVTMLELYTKRRRVILDKPVEKFKNMFTPKQKEVDIVSLLRTTKSPFYVTFTKKDGTRRDMYATRGAAFEDAMADCASIPRNRSENMLLVYDLEKHGIRTINLETVSFVKIDGVEYKKP